MKIWEVSYRRIKSGLVNISTIFCSPVKIYGGGKRSCQTVCNRIANTETDQLIWTFFHQYLERLTTNEKKIVFKVKSSFSELVYLYKVNNK